MQAFSLSVAADAAATRIIFLAEDDGNFLEAVAIRCGMIVYYWARTKNI